MIEPEYRGRLGVSIRCPADPSDEPFALSASRLNALGLQNLRLQVTQTDEPAWVAALLGAMSAAFTILPAIPLEYASGFLDTLCRIDRTQLSHVELTTTGGFGHAADCDTLSPTIARWVAAGFKVVVGLQNPEISALERLAGSISPDDVAAVGLDLTVNHDRSVHYEHYLSQALLAIRQARAGMKLWVTGLGIEPNTRNPSLPGRLLLDTLKNDTERVYWNTLSETPGTNAVSGLYDANGQPKLLGRLLSHGVKELDRVISLGRKRPAPAIVGCRPILVTGGAGFIGANLTDRLATEGHSVVIFDALLRPGVEQNLDWLVRRHPRRVSFVLGDLRDEDALAEATAQSEAVFHLAGQVAVTSSLVDPMSDFDINARGTLALLESIRLRNPDCPVVFASTNKVYGDLSDIALQNMDGAYLPESVSIRARGIAEDRPLCFHTPYGCSKGTADQYVLDYAASFGMKTAVLRMSCIYGERQLGTEDQGWVAHFLLRAMAGEPLTIYGDGRQVRDILHVGDAVSAYLAAWHDIRLITGKALNLGGGPANAVSLRHLIAHIEQLLGRSIDVRFANWRAGDQRYFVADTTAIRNYLELAPALGWREGVARLASYFNARSTELSDAVEAAS